MDLIKILSIFALIFAYYFLPVEASDSNQYIKKCIAKNDKYCLLKDEQVTSNSLVIYFRGHLSGYGNGVVDIANLDHSLDQAISYYGLDKTMEKTFSPMLITYSSHVSLAADEIATALDLASMQKSDNIILASHSGGNVGLLKTLENLKNSEYQFKITKIIMLDNFYFSGTKTNLIKEFIDTGASCSGFYTQHNEIRYNARFKELVPATVCPIEKRGDHNGDVNKCLAKYILSNKCS